ncbi:MAG: hypothetical protein Q4A01_11000 [Coriobacteriales bacterium]|nr:hypothetical protein [Coriobacteriales bacterium]
MDGKRRTTTVLVVGAIALLSTFPLFTPSATYGPVHDLPFHIARIQSIAQGLQAGVFPVRLYAAQASNFGYPCGICYPDLFLYVPGVLVALGMHPWPAYVLFVLLVNLATAAIAAYAFSRVFCSERVGLLCATLWVLSPYRLCDVWLRAAVGEYLALAFAPLIVLGLWRVFLDEKSEPGLGWLTLALGASAVIYSHVLSVAMFLAFALLAMIPLALWRKKSGCALAIAKAAGVTVLLTAAFLVPFLDYYLHHDLGVKYFGNSAHEHSLYPLQAAVPFQAFRGSSVALGEAGDEMPLEVGIALLVVLFVSVPVCVVSSLHRADQERWRRWVVLLACSSVAVLLLTTCLFPWGYDGPLTPLKAVVDAAATIQFPWRLLGIASLRLVLLAGSLAAYAVPRMRVLWVVCVVLCVVEACYGGVSYLLNAQPLEVGQHSVAGMDIGMGEYVPIQQSKDFAQNWDSFEPVAPDAVEIGGFARTTPQETCLHVHNASDQTQRVRLPLFWHQQLQVEPSDAGATLAWDDSYAALDVAPHASLDVTVAFVEPLLWRIAMHVSALTLLALVVLSIRARGTIP